AIDEEDEDEDEGDLHAILDLCDDGALGYEPVEERQGPYQRTCRSESRVCLDAGRSGMGRGPHRKILLLTTKGRGRIKSTNSATSAMSRAKTCNREDVVSPTAGR